MKTIVRKDNNVSIWLFDDDVGIAIGETQTDVSNNIISTISDCNTSNALLYENITPPTDWFYHKYIYTNNTWSDNPNFIDPRIERPAP